MKTAAFFKTVLMLASVLFLLSCEKESISELKVTKEDALGRVGDKVERPLTGTLYTSSTFYPDIEGGWDPENPTNVPAFYPGMGEGNVSHFGKIFTMFNQHAYGYSDPPTDPTTALGKSIPITEHLSLDTLKSYGFTEEDLSEIEAAGVGAIITDKHGNSIWAEGTSQYISLPDNPQRDLVIWEYEITGGTGKFEDAEGHFTLKGYTDVIMHADGTVTTKDELTIDGVIIY
ncbi:hypothetical protein [Pontibacter ruber]|uniref:Lipoprotein n=1 Tax=Pontibacter ruber TaxID=1343895 RepID=A0ABW5D0H6_9BACT|nr:hypothetical protein [Pontibacter ruber]